MTTISNSRYKTYFVTTVWVLAGILIGLVFILIFHWSDEPIKLGSALLWAGGYFSLGGLAGFIFGVPRIVTASMPTTTTPITPTPIFPPGGVPGAPAGPPDEYAAPVAQVLTLMAPPSGFNKRIIQENTNLTQVSDWLTKVIIGAGLVQLKEIPAFVMKVATKMGYGITKQPDKFSTADPAIILCAAIIIYFLTWGFVSGYLIMRLIVSNLLADSSE